MKRQKPKSSEKKDWSCKCPQCSECPSPTYSESWREETEAMYLLRLPKKQLREAYLNKVEEKRGKASRDRLDRVAMELYSRLANPNK